jgi:hypothetical protein
VFLFCSPVPSPMPRDFITLSDMPQAALGSPVTYASGASRSMWRPLKRYMAVT